MTAKNPLQALAALRQKWDKLSAEERFRFQMVTAFLLVVAYGLVFYPLSHGKLVASKQMLSRRMDRIKKRVGADEPGSGAANPQLVASQIAKVEARLKELGAGQVTGFAPADSAGDRQRLLLELSRLAERCGVQVLSVARKGANGAKGAGGALLDPVLGRPLLVFTGSARFGQLLQFLDGMKRLPFNVSVMNLKIASGQSQGSRRGEARAPEGALSIALEVSM